MTQKNQFTPRQTKTDKAYEALVQSMRDLYDGTITDHEAHDAARNLIAFFKTLLAMKAEQEHNHEHVQ